MANAARTAAACRIARLDRQKFNDLMASGEYDCAPRTSPGVPRVFEMPDLIGLYLFARLTENGRTVRQASDLVCKIVEQVRQFYGSDYVLAIDHVAIAYGLNGGSFCMAVRKDENGEPNANPFAAQDSGRAVMNIEVWNVRNVLMEVERGLREESRIAGGED